MKFHIPARFGIAAASGAILGTAALLPVAQNGVIASLPPLCPFHALTALPCPGCGLTRSFVCLAHGQWGQALGWHGLGPILFGATLLILLGALGNWRVSGRAQRGSLAVFTLAMLLHWVGRLSGIWPLGIILN